MRNYAELQTVYRAFQQKVFLGKSLFLLLGKLIDRKKLLLIPRGAGKAFFGRVPLFLRSRAEKLIPRRAEKLFPAREARRENSTFDLKMQ